VRDGASGCAGNENRKGTIMTRKHLVWSGILLALVALGGGSLALSGTGRHAAFAAPHVDIPWPPSSSALSELSLHFDTPTTAAAITADQAIQLAVDRRVGQAVADQATGVATHFVLFSDDDYVGTDAQGHSLCSTTIDADHRPHCHLAKIPAWVVTLEGVNYPLPGSSDSTPRYAHEVHVVIDARTGNDLELFYYR